MVAIKKSKSNTKLYTINRSLEPTNNNTKCYDKNIFISPYIFDNTNYNTSIYCGIDLITKDKLNSWIDQGSIIYEVDIPSDATTIKFYTARSKKYKIRVDKVTLKKKHYIISYKTIKKFNFKLDSEFIRRYLICNFYKYDIKKIDTMERLDRATSCVFQRDDDKDIIKLLQENKRKIKYDMLLSLPEDTDISKIYDLVVKNKLLSKHQREMFTRGYTFPY